MHRWQILDIVSCMGEWPIVSVSHLPLPVPVHIPRPPKNSVVRVPTCSGVTPPFRIQYPTCQWNWSYASLYPTLDAVRPWGWCTDPHAWLSLTEENGTLPLCLVAFMLTIGALSSSLSEIFLWCACCLLAIQKNTFLKHAYICVWSSWPVVASGMQLLVCGVFCVSAFPVWICMDFSKLIRKRFTSFAAGGFNKAQVAASDICPSSVYWHNLQPRMPECVIEGTE